MEEKPQIETESILIQEGGLFGRSYIDKFVDSVTDATRDPFKDLEGKLEEFKEKTDELGNRSIRRASESITDASNRIDQIEKASIDRGVSRLLADRENYEKLSLRRPSGRGVRTGFISNPVASDYTNILGYGGLGSRMAMFQVQERSFINEMGKRDSFELLTQVSGRLQPSTSQELTDKAESVGIVGPSKIAVDYLRANTASKLREQKARLEELEKATPSNKRQEEIEKTQRRKRNLEATEQKPDSGIVETAFTGGELMHAKVGYSYAERTLAGNAGASSSQLAMSAFLTTQNITKALYSSNTQEEGLMLTRKGDFTTQNSLNNLLIDQIQRVTDAIYEAGKENPTNYTEMLRGVEQRLLTIEAPTNRQYIKVGSQIHQEYKRLFKTLESDATKKAGVNIQYLEKFLLGAGPLEDDTNDFRSTILKSMLKLSAEGRLSITLSDTSVNKELGFRKLMELAEDRKITGASAEILKNLLEKNQIRILPTRFLHTKSVYIFDQENQLIGLALGSQNFSSQRFTDAKTNLEAVAFLYDYNRTQDGRAVIQEAGRGGLADIGINERDAQRMLQNTAFGSTAQQLQIENYSNSGAVNRIFTSLTNFKSQQENLGSFELQKRYKSLGAGVAARDLSDLANKLASGIEITMPSGYSFSVTVGKTIRDGQSEDVIYLNKGNRVITGGIYKNREGSGVDVQIPGREQLLHPGETTKLTAGEVLQSMIYTMGAAEKYDTQIRAPLETVRQTIGLNQGKLKVEIAKILQKAASRSDGSLSTAVLANTFGKLNAQLLEMYKDNDDVKRAVLDTRNVDEFRSKGFFNRRDNVTEVIERMSDLMSSELMQYLKPQPSEGGVEYLKGYADILYHLTQRNRTTRSIFEREVKEGRRLVLSQVVSSFFQSHESMFRGNQLLHQQPLFEMSASVARMHGELAQPTSARPSIISILSGADLSHADRLYVKDEGKTEGGFIRTVADSSRVIKQDEYNIVGGLISPEGGMTKVTWAKGFMRSTTNFDFIEAGDYQDREGLELFGRTGEEQQQMMYYFPYAKTEQLSGRLKNKKSERGLLQSSAEFTEMINSLGLKFGQAMSDPLNIIGGKVPIDVPAEQYEEYKAILHRYKGDKAKALGHIKRNLLNPSNATGGLLGRDAPGQFMLSVGVSTMSDFGYLNEGPARRRKLIDIQKQSATYQSREVGANFYARVGSTLKAGTMFVARDYRLDSDFSRDLQNNQQIQGEREQLLDIYNKARLGAEATYQQNRDTDSGEFNVLNHLKQINKEISKQTGDVYSVSIEDNKPVFYLKTGVFRRESPDQKLKRVGELTPSLTFFIYSLETENITNNRESSFLHITNAAISRRENLGIAILSEDASVTQSGSSQQILEMSYIVALNPTSGMRGLGGMKGPLVYMQEAYFNALRDRKAGAFSTSLMPETLQKTDIEGILSPGQIKDFNYTAGFALLSDPESGFRQMLSDSRGDKRVELGKKIALGLSLILQDVEITGQGGIAQASKIRNENNESRLTFGKSLFAATTAGAGSLAIFKDLSTLIQDLDQTQPLTKARLEEGLQTTASEAMRNNIAAERLVDSYQKMVNQALAGKELAGTIKSETRTRGAALVAILTSMASDIDEGSRGFVSKIETRFDETGLDTYKKSLNQPQELTAAEDSMVKAQRQSAFALGINLRKITDDRELGLAFNYLESLYSKNIYVRQFFEYGVSRIAVATGMQDSTALEASYVKNMTAQQLKTFTLNPKARRDITTLQGAIFSMVLSTRALFPEGSLPGLASGTNVAQPRQLISMPHKLGVKAYTPQRKQAQAVSFINEFTTAYSVFSRADLPDYEGDSKAIRQSPVRAAVRAFADGDGVNRQLRRMRRYKAVALSTDIDGGYGDDMSSANRNTRSQIDSLIKDSLDYKINRLTDGKSEPEDDIKLGHLRNLKSALTSGGAEHEQEVDQMRRSMYERVKRVKLALGTSGGDSAYIESLTVLYGQVYGEEKILGRLIKDLEKDKTKKKELKKANKRRDTFREVKKELLQTRTYQLPSLVSSDGLDVMRTGEDGLLRLAINSQDTVTGALLGLDILHDIKLNFHGYSDKVLADQQNLRSLISQAQETGLLRKISRQAAAIAKGKKPFLELTQSQAELYRDLLLHLEKSRVSTIDLFSNQENLRRLQADRLKQVGTTYVAVSSFLPGTHEFAAGARLERIQQQGLAAVAERKIVNSIVQELNVKGPDNKRRIASYDELTDEKKARVLRLSKRLLKNAGTGEDLYIKGRDNLDSRIRATDTIKWNLGTEDTDRQLLEYVIRESHHYGSNKQDPNDPVEPGTSRLLRALIHAQSEGKTRGVSLFELAAVARTGAPGAASYNQDALLQQGDMAEMNNRATPDGLRYSETLSDTLMLVPALGYQYTQFGDYDGDSFQVAFSRLASITAEIERLNSKINKFDTDDPGAVFHRKAKSKLERDLIEQYEALDDQHDITVRKAQEDQSRFTQDFMILPEEVVSKMSYELRSSIIKQQRDSLSGSYAAAEHTRDGILKDISQVTLDAEGKIQTDGLTNRSNVDYIQRLAGALTEQGFTTQGKDLAQVQAALLEKEAEFVNTQHSLVNVRKLVSNAAGSLLSESELRVIQATLGTTGMGLLGQIYNTVTPMMELAVGDYGYLRALENPELSTRLITAFQSRGFFKGQDPTKVHAVIKDNYKKRTANAYRFSVLTQQFMRDAALKPKQGQGVLQIAQEKGLFTALEQADKDNVSAAEKKTIFSNFINQHVGMELGTKNTPLSAFGALSLVEQYMVGGMTAEKMMGPDGSLRSYLQSTYQLAKQKQENLTEGKHVVNSIIKLVNKFQEDYVIDSVLEADSESNRFILSELAEHIIDSDVGQELVSELDKEKTSKRGEQNYNADIYKRGTRDYNTELYRRVIRRQQAESVDLLRSQIVELKDYNDRIAGLRTTGMPGELDDSIIKKMTELSVKIQRGNGDPGDMSEFINVLTTATEDIRSKGELSQEHVRGLTALMGIGGLIPSVVKTELDKIQDPAERLTAERGLIEALTTAPEGQRSIAEDVSDYSAVAATRRDLLQNADRLSSQRLITDDPLQRDYLDARRENLLRSADELTVDNLQQTRTTAADLMDYGQQLVEDASRASTAAANDKTIKRLKGSHNRGELLSVLAVPIMFSSFQGGTFSPETAGILASNLFQSAVAVSSFESSVVGQAIYGPEASRTELNRSLALQAQMQQARIQGFIRSNTNQFEGLAQGLGFEILSGAGARLAVEAAGRGANRLGLEATSARTRGMVEVAGGLAGMVVAGVITSRTIPGSNQQMGGVPDYILDTLQKISQSVQGAAQRFLQDLIDEPTDVSIDNEPAELNATDINPGIDAEGALGNEAEKDIFTGWASPEETNIFYGDSETGLESIELSDSTEMTG
jgi:hypothetical protein